MTVYRLFKHDDPIPCLRCDQQIGRAGDGDVVGFGDGNGNRELKCSACGWINAFDVTKSQDRVESFNTQHSETIAEIKASLPKKVDKAAEPALKKRAGTRQVGRRKESTSEPESPSENAFEDLA